MAPNTTCNKLGSLTHFATSPLTPLRLVALHQPLHLPLDRTLPPSLVSAAYRDSRHRVSLTPAAHHLFPTSLCLFSQPLLRSALSLSSVSLAPAPAVMSRRLVVS